MLSLLNFICRFQLTFPFEHPAVPRTQSIQNRVHYPPAQSSYGASEKQPHLPESWGWHLTLPFPLHQLRAPTPKSPLCPPWSSPMTPVLIQTKTSPTWYHCRWLRSLATLTSSWREFFNVYF